MWEEVRERTCVGGGVLEEVRERTCVGGGACVGGCVRSMWEEVCRRLGAQWSNPDRDKICTSKFLTPTLSVTMPVHTRAHTHTSHPPLSHTLTSPHCHLILSQTETVEEPIEEEEEEAPTEAPDEDEEEEATVEEEKEDKPKTKTVRQSQ